MQVVADETDLVDACRRLRSGWTVTVDGELASRPHQSVKVDDPTGGVELSLRRLVVITETSVPDKAAAALGAARLEDAARDALRRVGFANAGARPAVRLTRYLPSHERVYRVRTAPVADGEGDGGALDASVLELELAFAELEDLADVVRRVYGALEPLLPRAVTLHAVSPATADTALEWSADQTLLLGGLPASGHAAFGGRDLCLTMLARASATSAEWVECVVLVVCGRVVGAGSVLTDDRERALRAIEALGPLDPMTSYELDDAVAAASSGTAPGRAWFALDFERLWEAASPDASGKRDVELLRRDLSSILHIADSERLSPSSTRAAVAAAARRIEQSDVEAYSAMARSRSARASNRAAGAVSGLDAVLADFAMEAGVCEALLELDPGGQARLARRTPGERFQWLWSVLGNEHVRVALKHGTSYDTIRRAVELKIVTDLQQLRYLDVASLEELSVILERAGSKRTVQVLRQALALSPASFTSLLAALAAVDGPRVVAEADAAPIVQAARHWLCAPGLFDLGLRAARGGRISALLDGLRTVSPQVLPNSPVDPRELIESFHAAVRERVPELAGTLGEPSEGLASALVQHIFRPISLTYSEAQHALTELDDHCEDVSEAGLATGARHWSAADSCYMFADPRGSALRMYLSKNIPSFLAKATVGICTSRDVELWARRDHMHLNVLDPSSGIVVGNIQLHVLVREGRRILLIRAMNASISYLTAAKARAFVEGALVACVEIAASSEIDELHLCESLSFWHLNSSRPEIRAVLEPLYLELASTVLEPPFFLFRFGGVDLELTKTYRLWERDRASGARYPLRRFLEVVN
jgi:hypothetical protein